MVGFVGKEDLGRIASPPLAGVAAAAPDWTADRCRKSPGKEHTPLVKAKERELAAREKFDVSSKASKSPSRKVLVGAPSKNVASFRWAMAWKEVDSRATGKARSASGGFQDPGMENGLAEAVGCVGLRPSCLHFIALSGVRIWKLCSAGTRDAFLQPGSLGREVYLWAAACLETKSPQL